MRDLNGDGILGANTGGHYTLTKHKDNRILKMVEDVALTTALVIGVVFVSVLILGILYVPAGLRAIDWMVAG